MNSLKKLVTLIAPVAVLALTSCNSGLKNVSYSEMYDYVYNNYEIHSLDETYGRYNFNIDNFGLSLSADVFATNVGKTNFNAAFGIQNTTIGLDNIPCECLSTTKLNQINTMYTKYSAITMEWLTKIGLDLSYQLGNGCAAITFATTTDDGLLTIIESLFPVLHAAYLFMPETIADIKVLNTLAQYGVGLAKSSTAKGYAGVTLKTDKEGFFTDVSVKFKAEDMNLNLCTGNFGMIEKIDEAPFYAINIKGSVNMEFSVKVTF